MTITSSSSSFSVRSVPAGSLSRGGDVAVYVFDVNQPSLPSPFHSVLVSISAFMALSTVFHSINSPDNSPLSHSVLLILLCLMVLFNYVSLYESLPQPSFNPLWLTRLKAPTNLLTKSRFPIVSAFFLSPTDTFGYCS